MKFGDLSCGQGRAKHEKRTFSSESHEKGLPEKGTVQVGVSPGKALFNFQKKYLLKQVFDQATALSFVSHFCSPKGPFSQCSCGLGVHPEPLTLFSPSTLSLST